MAAFVLVESGELSSWDLKSSGLHLTQMLLIRLLK
jgi:hypothetical protein